VQEGVTNARRHSGSERVRVALVQRGDQVRITVQDWGDGFDPEQARGRGFGLEGIQERARLLGGHASIESTPGEGTVITVELPLG
jgi:signal transduction histidine kinase